MPEIYKSYKYGHWSCPTHTAVCLLREESKNQPPAVAKYLQERGQLGHTGLITLAGGITMAAFCK